MKNIELEDLKKTEVGILSYVDDFCKKNEINYWVDCGTLLGAVRHKGFIPWDDDIDIGMLRSDYNKFVELFNKDNNSKYNFKCHENDKNWPFPFGKVLDTNTVLYEPDKKHGYESSVYIDVFPYDNAPDEHKKMMKMFKKRDMYMKFAKLQRYSGFYYESKKKYNFVRYPIHLSLQIFPKDYFIKKCIKNSLKYEKSNTKSVGNFTSSSKQHCDKHVFDSFVEVEFEGKKYPAPIGYDDWLRSFYGDYMKLPPKEKQVSHHRFEAYFR